MLRFWRRKPQHWTGQDVFVAHMGKNRIGTVLRVLPNGRLVIKIRGSNQSWIATEVKSPLRRLLIAVIGPIASGHEEAAAYDYDPIGLVFVGRRERKSPTISLS